jgi:hypothetical protein
MISKSFLTATLATLLLGAIVAPHVNAGPATSSGKTVGSDGTTIGTDGDTWFLRTPVADTTESFSGGTLRVYDVHIAKMVEITHYQCNNTRSRRDRTWFYHANDINMGQFRISCDLAKDLAIAYGMDKAEPTAIFMAEIEEPSTKLIPTLNITGGKVKTWMKFTQNFKPIR